MARKAPAVEGPEVSMRDYETFAELLEELAKKERSHVRLAKVADQGFVEAARKGSAFVMQPRVRVVATVLDHKRHQILRYAEKRDVGTGVVSVYAGGGSSHDDRTGKQTRDRMVAALEARGIAVSEGEWTAESARDALNG